VRSTSALPANTVEPALPGDWCCPLQGGRSSGTKSAKPGGVPYLAAQMVPAGLVMGTPTELPYSVHEPS
jgi:hypothetical protein